MCGVKMGLFAVRTQSVAAQQLFGQIWSTLTVGVGSSERGAGQTANMRTTVDFQTCYKQVYEN